MQGSTSPFSKVRGKQVDKSQQPLDQMLMFSLAAADSNRVKTNGNQTDSNSNSGIQTPTFKNDSSGISEPL
jgi:hypothetical protein